MSWRTAVAAAGRRVAGAVLHVTAVSTRPDAPDVVLPRARGAAGRDTSVWTIDAGTTPPPRPSVQAVEAGPQGADALLQYADWTLVGNAEDNADELLRGQDYVWQHSGARGPRPSSLPRSDRP